MLGEAGGHLEKSEQETSGQNSRSRVLTKPASDIRHAGARGATRGVSDFAQNSNSRVAACCSFGEQLAGLATEVPLWGGHPE